MRFLRIFVAFTFSGIYKCDIQSSTVPPGDNTNSPVDDYSSTIPNEFAPDHTAVYSSSAASTEILTTLDIVRANVTKDHLTSTNTQTGTVNRHSQIRDTGVIIESKTSTNHLKHHVELGVTEVNVMNSSPVHGSSEAFIENSVSETDILNLSGKETTNNATLMLLEREDNFAKQITEKSLMNKDDRISKQTRINFSVDNFDRNSFSVTREGRFVINLTNDYQDALNTNFDDLNSVTTPKDVDVRDMATNQSQKKNITRNEPDEQSAFGLFNVSNKGYAIIYFSVTILVSAFGLAGNSMLILVMRKVPFKSSSYGIYLSALALADMISCCGFIVTAASQWRYLFNLHMARRTTSSATCTLRIYVLIFTRVLSSTNITFVCIERFVAVWLPFKAKVLATKRVAWAFVSSSFIVANLVGAANTVEILVSPEVGSCRLGQYSGFVMSVLGFYMPTALLSILTPLILIKIRRGDKERRQNLTNNPEQDKLPRVAKMLMGSLISYLVLNTPASVMLGVSLSDAVEASTPHTLLWFKIAVDVTIFLKVINHSIAIIIYGFVSSQFRNQLFSLVRKPTRN